MEFRVLGPLSVRGARGNVPVTGSLQRTLLALLLASAGRPVAVSVLTDALWPDVRDEIAQQRLQVHVHRLRRLLDDAERIVFDQNAYRLRLEPDELDAERFERLIAEATELGTTDPARCAERTREGLALWRGEAYAGTDVPALTTAAHRLEELRLTAFELRYDAELRCGRHAAVVAELAALARAYPLREKLCALLMTALYLGGRQAEALEAYRRARRTLVDELGLEPGPELRELERRVLVGEPPIDGLDPSAASSVDPSAASSAVSSVEPAVDPSAVSSPRAPTSASTETPAETPAAGAAGTPHQLPADILDFTGRTTELAALLDLLREPASAHTTRAHTAARTDHTAARTDHTAACTDHTAACTDHHVTRRTRNAPAIAVLHGMGGVGKTRLAVHAAHQLRRAGRYDDGELYVDLRGVGTDEPASPSDVLETFLRDLGVPGRAIPPDQRARSAMFRDRLAGKRILLLLDNAIGEEQLLPLLPGEPQCAVIVTSRRNLALEGAVSIPVDVFPESDALDFLAYNAGPDRIAAEPTESVEIVRLCGRLPIAVALAAHRLRARPAWRVADLRDRLRDQDAILGELVAGSRAVQDVVQLSYDALDPLQRKVFRALGDHPGEDATAASAAALAGLPRGRCADILESLLDESLLVQATPHRYRMHDLVRSYARGLVEKLEPAESRTAALQALLRHLVRTTTSARRALDRHLHPVFEDVDGVLDEPGDPASFAGRDEALAWFHVERPNLVAAIHAGVRGGAYRLTWQLAATLLSFFYLSKHWDDWLTSHRLGLHAAERAGDLAGQARIRMGFGVAYDDLGSFDEAIGHHRVAAELFARTTDRRGEAWNYDNLGVVYDNLRRFAEAKECYRAALEIFGSLDDPKGQGMCLNNLGDVHRQLGRYAEAERALEEAARLHRTHGDREVERITFGTFGDLYRDVGDLERARRAYRKAIDLCLEYGDRWRAGQLLSRLENLGAPENFESPGNPENPGNPGNPERSRQSGRSGRSGGSGRGRSGAQPASRSAAAPTEAIGSGVQGSRDSSTT